MDSYLNINDSNMRREINVTDIYDKEDNNYNNYDNMNTTDPKSIDPNCVDVIGVDVDSGDNLDVSCSRGLTVNGCGSDDCGGCRDGWHGSGSNSSNGCGNSKNDRGKSGDVSVAGASNSVYRGDQTPIQSKKYHIGKPPGLWSVELAMGYPWTIRFPVNYSGAIILHFEDTLTTGIIHSISNRQEKNEDNNFNQINDDEATYKSKEKNKNDVKNDKEKNKNNNKLITRKFKKMDKRKAVLSLFLFLMLTSMLVYIRIFHTSRDGRRMQRIFHKYLAWFCSCFDYIRVCFIRLFRLLRYGSLNGNDNYTQTQNRDRGRNRHGNYVRGGDRDGDWDDDEESLDRNVLSSNTQHNSITTLNSITSHINLSLYDRNRFRPSKSSFAASQSTDSGLTMISINNDDNGNNHNSSNHNNNNSNNNDINGSSTDYDKKDNNNNDNNNNDYNKNINDCNINYNNNGNNHNNNNDNNDVRKSINNNINNSMEEYSCKRFYSDVDLDLDLDNDNDLDDNFLDNNESCQSSIGKTVSTRSLQSNISTDSLPRKKIITWGTFTHLSPPSLFKKSGSSSGSESSSLQSKSSSSISSDGGYGSVSSMNSADI